jgi:1,4-dihydroxy-6-naphthoate synthase
MDISIGHTPDADDAFMFYGISTGKVNSPNFSISHIVEDIESLNKRAIKHELDVTAISAHTYAYLNDYVLLNSGGSFGLNYGPIVISKRPLSTSQLKNCVIAIPGEMTSATLLLKLAIGNFKYISMSFNAIGQAVMTDSVDAGLVIHEDQIAYDKQKLIKVFDIGPWWNEKTGGLPVPLGVNVASKRSMNRRQIQEFDLLFKRSITYGIENVESAIDYAMEYSRGQPKDLIKRFVQMYVNNITVDMGPQGESSIRKLFELADEHGILPMPVIDIIKST